MIFLTLGTHQPFDRLVRLVDAWCRDNPGVEVFGQITAPSRGAYEPKHFKWASHVSPHDYNTLVKQADFVVAHAGMGSIITALCASTPIVVFPRRADLMEQRNDHQLATAQRFKAVAGVTVAQDEAELFAAMDALAQGEVDMKGATLDAFAAPQLTDALRSAIHSSPKRRVRAVRLGGARPHGASDRLAQGY